MTAAIFARTTEGKPSQARGLALLAMAVAWTALLDFLMFVSAEAPEAGFLKLIINFHMCFGFAPGVAAIIFCCARYDNFATRFLSRPMVTLVGDASYSLYFLHIEIVSFFAYGEPLADVPRIAMGSAIRLGLCLVSCVGASLVTWRLIEVPMRNWVRRTFSLPVARVLQAVEEPARSVALPSPISGS